MAGWVIAMAGLLGGCAAEPRLVPGPQAGFAEARRLLVERAAAGPVVLDVLGVSALATTELAERAAQGVPGATVRFIPAQGQTDRQRLVLAFGEAEPAPGLRADRACDGALAMLTPAPGVPRPLLAVFCDGRRPVAEVTALPAGAAAADEARLVWRTTARLFPDDYPSTYGWRLFEGLRIGLGGSFGF